MVGDVCSPSSSYLTVKNAMTLNNGRLVFTGAGAAAYFQNSPSVTGTGEIVMSSTSNVLYPLAADTTITFGPNVIVRGRGTIYGDYYTGSTIVNQGTIRADISAATLVLRGTNWVNQGLLEATNGGSLQLASTFDRRTGHVRRDARHDRSGRC